MKDIRFCPFVLQPSPGPPSSPHRASLPQPGSGKHGGPCRSNLSRLHRPLHRLSPVPAVSPLPSSQRGIVAIWTSRIISLSIPSRNPTNLWSFILSQFGRNTSLDRPPPMSTGSIPASVQAGQVTWDDCTVLGGREVSYCL